MTLIASWDWQTCAINRLWNALVMQMENKTSFWSRLTTSTLRFLLMISRIAMLVSVSETFWLISTSQRMPWRSLNLLEMRIRTFLSHCLIRHISQLVSKTTNCLSIFTKKCWRSIFQVIWIPPCTSARPIFTRETLNPAKSWPLSFWTSIQITFRLNSISHCVFISRQKSCLTSILEE